jgi:sec-independent protein translocase protein TatA
MPGWIGPGEIAMMLLVALLLFGPKKLPEMGRSLGKGMREFKESIAGLAHQPEESDPVTRPQLTASTADGARDNDAI